MGCQTMAEETRRNVWLRRIPWVVLAAVLWYMLEQQNSISREASYAGVLADDCQIKLGPHA